MWRLLGPVLLVVLLATGCNHRDDTSVYGGISTYHPRVQHTKVESYRGVQVTVPRSWAPARLGCAEPAHGYVARPVAGCDATTHRLPSRPAVWFDSPLPVGIRHHEGLTVRTVAVDGRRLTAAATEEESDRIVHSAHTVGTDDNGCPLRPPAPGTWPDGGLGSVYAFSVCVYPRPHAELIWSGALPPRRGSRFVGRLVHGDRIRGLPRRDEGELPVVMLIVEADPEFGTFPAKVRFQVQFDPGRVVGGPRLATVALDQDLARPWAVPGVRTYLPAGLLPG